MHDDWNVIINHTDNQSHEICKGTVTTDHYHHITVSDDVTTAYSGLLSFNLEPLLDLVHLVPQYTIAMFDELKLPSEEKPKSDKVVYLLGACARNPSGDVGCDRRAGDLKAAPVTNVIFD